MTTLIDAPSGPRPQRQEPIVCLGCQASFSVAGVDTKGCASHATAARAQGWTVWSGTTMGGSEDHRVYCPFCAGRVTDEDGQPVEAKWDARCDTCDDAASECDEYEDEPFSKKDAERWMQDHECEPYTVLVPPTGLAVAR